MLKKLSICIPTYNRANFLAETLESILLQITDEVEIVISDNASTDNTRELVLKYMEQNHQISYFRWDQNRGADQNFLKVIELAQGKYCWFMGSDDRVEEGCVSKVLSVINHFSDLSGITVDNQKYDYFLQNKMKTRQPQPAVNDMIFSNAEECFSILGPYFGYLSAQIINKQIWDQVVCEKDISLYFNSYIHVYVIANMLLKSPNWLYLNAKCVGRRSDNDSFLIEGRYNRLMIDIKGYEEITKAVFGKESKAYDSMVKFVSSVHVSSAILQAKINKAPVSFYLKSFMVCIKKYYKYPVFWLKTFPFFILPSSLLRGIKSVYEKRNEVAS